ncbi:hypothetical protein JQ625_19335 [Bradyrhizobium diazoefficiens]|nr:hypothetical protein [Bradyrhizobium diazoefficiens]MBR0776995.1 hypothetical protein [Bradyrhizobium diazoefficiens]
MRYHAGPGFALLYAVCVVAFIALSGVARAEVPFTFTVPQSQVLLKITVPLLVRDVTPSTKPNYFKLTRKEPFLIVSGWLEPAQGYKGLTAFWDSESRSPAFAGPRAPIRVEKLREGAWEVVAFDLSVPGVVQSNLRAERVEANTWIDLHLSTTVPATSPSTKVRAELLAALRQVQVLQK